MEPIKRQSLDKILESVTVVSWTDLMRGAQAGVIHILPTNRGRQGLLQIAAPTEEKTATAEVSVSNAYECIKREIAQPTVA